MIIFTPTIYESNTKILETLKLIQLLFSDINLADIGINSYR